MIRVAICDDSDIQRQIIFDILTEYIYNRKCSYDVTQFSNGPQLLEDVEKNGAYDIYILDQVMPFLKGMELAEKIREADPDCAIVFISSDSDAVFDAFKVKAIGYIKKPINIKRFYEVFDRLNAELNAADGGSFIFKGADGDRKLRYDDVLYIIKADRALECHLSDGTVLGGKSLRKSVKETLAPLLEAGGFVMGGASVLINLSKIESVTPDDVILSGGEYLHIPARSYKEIYEAWSTR